MRDTEGLIQRFPSFSTSFVPNIASISWPGCDLLLLNTPNNCDSLETYFRPKDPLNYTVHGELLPEVHKTKHFVASVYP
jgi:hypothetical protein